MKILLVEDNLALAKQVGEFLAGHRWHVDHAATGKLAVELATSAIFDVVVLDLNLPDQDGLLVCEQIKQACQVIPAVIMVTARDSFSDKSAGFGKGADDYLTKPFDLRELVLRCQALAKRHQLHQRQEVSLGELRLDLTNKLAFRNNAELALTQVGFKILTLLVNSYPQPVSRALLIHTLWQDDPPDSDALKSHIYGLRQVLDKPFSYPMLKTLLNVGYRLQLQESKGD